MIQSRVIRHHQSVAAAGCRSSTAWAVRSNSRSCTGWSSVATAVVSTTAEARLAETNLWQAELWQLDTWHAWSATAIATGVAARVAAGSNWSTSRSDWSTGRSRSCTGRTVVNGSRSTAGCRSSSRSTGSSRSCTGRSGSNARSGRSGTAWA